MKIEKMTIEQLNGIEHLSVYPKKTWNIVEGEHGEAISHAISVLLLMAGPHTAARPCVGTKITGEISAEEDTYLVMARHDGKMYHYSIRGTQKYAEQAYLELANPAPTDHYLDYFDGALNVPYSRRFAYYRTGDAALAEDPNLEGKYYRCQEKQILQNVCFQRCVRQHLERLRIIETDEESKHGLHVNGEDILYLSDENVKGNRNTLELMSFMELCNLWDRFLKEKNFHAERRPLLISDIDVESICNLHTAKSQQLFLHTLPVH